MIIFLFCFYVFLDLFFFRIWISTPSIMADARPYFMPSNFIKRRRLKRCWNTGVTPTFGTFGILFYVRSAFHFTYVKFGILFYLRSAFQILFINNYNSFHYISNRPRFFSGCFRLLFFRNLAGDTALINACRIGNDQVVQHLLDYVIFYTLGCG